MRSLRTGEVCPETGVYRYVDEGRHASAGTTEPPEATRYVLVLESQLMPTFGPYRLAVAYEGPVAVEGAPPEKKSSPRVFGL
jgi:hypothetical protein